MSETIRIALYSNEKDNTPKSRDVTWEELRDDLLHSFTVTSCDPCDDPRGCFGKHGPAWSPVRIEGRRSSDNVREVTALVLDLDHLTIADYRQTVEALKPYRHILHSTHSHRPPNDIALRGVVALSRPVQASEWSRFRPAAVRLLGVKADPATKDPSRLFYLPTSSKHRMGAKFGFVALDGDGPALDVDTVLAERAPVPEPVAVEPEAGQSEEAADLADFAAALKALRKSAKLRNDKRLASIYDNALAGKELVPAGEGQEPALHSLMAGLAMKLPVGTRGQDVVENLVRPTIIAMGPGPQGFDHWFKRAAESFDRRSAQKAKEEAELAEFSKRLTAPFVAQVEARRNERREASATTTTESVEDASADDWTDELIRVIEKNGTIALRSCDFNATHILTHAREWKGAIRYNELTTFVTIDPGTPLGSRVRPETFPRKLTDWLQKQCGIYLAEPVVKSIATAIARDNGYDPLTDYIESLPAWDGTVRRETFLERAANASLVGDEGQDITDHVRRVSTKFLISAAVRVLSPGEQVDTVLVLEGAQGTGKTSLLRLLAGEFYASPKRDLDDKDTQLLVKKSWIVEIEELAAFKGKAYQNLKRFFGATKDQFRPPYGQVIEDHPRRCVFVGTVNPEHVDGAEYLNDPTGNRRYWPVAVGRIDRTWVKAHRDQVWAEAIHVAREALRLRKQGGDEAVPVELRWWLTDEQEAVAAKEAEARVAEPIASSLIRDWILAMAPEKRRRPFTIDEVCRDALGIPADRIATDPRAKLQAGYALKALGIRHERRRVGSGRPRVYIFPDELLNEGQVVKNRAGTLALMAGGKS